jgi:hypothetical protein
VPEDLRAAKVLERYGSLPDLLKGFVETKAKVGAKGVTVPGRHATDGERSEFYKAIGRPDDPAGYEPADLPENFELPDDDLGSLREFAHAQGLSKAQGEAMIAEYARRAAGGLDAQQQQRERFQAESIAALKKDYGEQLPKVLERAKLAIREIGGDTLAQAMNQTGLGDHPEMVRAWIKIADMIGDDPGLETGRANALNTAPIEARQQIEQMKSDHEFMRKLRTGDKAAKSQWDRAWSIASPAGVTVR